MDLSVKREFAEFMVRAGVLTFGDFTTKSGRKTPYFINTGNCRTGSQIAKLGEFYAACIRKNGLDGIDALFGPAYKGIPLAVTTAIALSEKYGMDISFCFNRKEEKDHGEGGSIVGYKFKDGDRILMVEDVITAGTAVRECLPILKSAADVEIEGLVISVDRMERGNGNRTAIQEIFDEYGITTYPIITVREIIDALYNVPVDGKIHIDDNIRERMEAYMEEYCVR